MTLKLDIQGLCWDVPNTQRRILDHIDLSIQEGKFVGLIGPNGAGKSSLMRSVYRVHKPSSGKVLVNGKDIWSISTKQAAQQTAVILQEQSEHMGLTVREVVAQGLTPHKGLFEPDSQQEMKRIDELIEEFELDSMSKSLFSNLSGGEKQRVFLARAIVQNPSLLIMDEPTNHLDIHFQLEVLRSVKAMPLTVFASFHDLNLAAAFCDELHVIHRGRIVASGSPQQVITEDMIGDVFRACCVVDQHPLYGHPRISYAYHALGENNDA
jgi:iron complex transport system ATP-binding protein